ncbi:ABC transporter ATP-binding protein [Tianweitania sp. BSSL-BM11]|uniref:ABC transporter ATP-binding protein n=1 Tax=Tianweitania aestuarii TaxID=2814886 RepID=A0ABS5RWS9_9HYPH|nr:ABC transporter ATP-binding protein [Tianweitania aestuarii]MBS9721481.1 ABC transporter ATP-binding protein [Tianweitania aestuarii]
MIEINDVQKAYGLAIVVKGVSLALPKGGITSIIGPNGAGKSTLLSMISRLLPMDRGRVLVDGFDVTTTKSDVLAKRLSILRQDNHMTARLTVRDLVAFGRYPYSRDRPTVEDRAHIDQALGFLDLQPLADRFLDELSGGQRQRAFVAMVLCQDTDYALFDEPLNNLDMRHAAAMMRLLRRAADEFGKTIVLVLHDINFASCYSDHIVAMRSGAVAFQGTPEAVMRKEVLTGIFETEIDIHDIADRRIAVFY